MPKFLIGLLAAFLFCAAAAGQAAELAPFAVRNLAPPVLVHGLVSAEPLPAVQRGRIAGELALELANHALLETDGQHDLVLDGETFVGTIRVRYGLTDSLFTGFDLPWVDHSGGFLDPLIRDWHGWFGLPNGDRDELQDDRLNFSLQKGSDRLFRLDRARRGFGDLRLHLGWQPGAGPGRTWFVRGQVKVPTGDPDRLTGSGAWDFSLALGGQIDFSPDKNSVAVWTGVGLNRLGNGELLPDRVETWVVNGWLGAGWEPLRWVQLKLQLDGHSPLYASRLQSLGDPAWILTFGGMLVLDSATRIEIAVSEDLQVNASPDVVFRLGLQRHF